MRASLAALVVLTACARPLPPAPVEPAGGIARCALRGVISTNDNEVLRATARGKEVAARLFGGRVGVVASVLVPGGPASVVVRDPPEGPALAITGWLETRQLDLHARRDLTVAGRIRIQEHARLLVRWADDRALRVSASDGELRRIAAPASCDDLRLGVGPGPRWGRWDDVKGWNVHVRGSRLRFYGDAGELLVDVEAEHEAMTFVADRIARGMTHVHYREGLVIDAWMRSSDLEAGVGIECDDCSGEDFLDSMDRCPGDEDDRLDGFQDEDGCPNPPPRARATRDVEVAYTPGGPAIGLLERGAEVWTPRRRDGFVRIATIHGVLRPPARSGFWVAESALSP